MKISVWHNSLKQYLVGKFPTLTKWEAERPMSVQEVTAFLPPLQDVHYYRNGEQVHGKGMQMIGLIYRLPHTFTLASLPIGTYEGVHANLAIRLVREFGSIADIFGLSFIANNPFSITELTDGKGDWVITISWQFTIQWIAELEEDIPLRYDIRNVSSNIKRALAQDGKQQVTLVTPNVIDNRLHIERLDA